MTWYSVGTISLTNDSAIVTGTGTAWVSNIRAGWGLIGPGGTILGEIASVNSDTSLTMTENYTGANLTGQSYKVIPTQGLELNIASQLSSLISDYQAVKDGAGAGKFPDGTAPAPGLRFLADADTGMRRIGSNQASLVAGGADILKWSGTGAVLAGLLTGTAVQQGSTDATAGRLMPVGGFGIGGAFPSDAVDFSNTALLGGIYTRTSSSLNGFPNTGSALVLGGYNNSRCILGIDRTTGAVYVRATDQDGTLSRDWDMLYSRATAIGTVSQSGGAPTGALVEVGNNANGDYVRWADGRQECRAAVTLSYSSNSSCVATWTFPAAFVAAPVVSVSLGNIANSTPAESDLGTTRCSYASMTQATLRQARVLGHTDFAAGDSVVVTASAYGRWV